MEQVSTSVIQDIDGSVITVADFLYIAPEKLTKIKTKVPADIVNRPDLLAVYIYGNSAAYPMLMFAINKCLLDLEPGEDIEAYL